MASLQLPNYSRPKLLVSNWWLDDGRWISCFQGKKILFVHRTAGRVWVRFAIFSCSSRLCECITVIINLTLWIFQTSKFPKLMTPKSCHVLGEVEVSDAAGLASCIHHCNGRRAHLIYKTFSLAAQPKTFHVLLKAPVRNSVWGKTSIFVYTLA